MIEADAFAMARFWDERVERLLVMTSCNLGHVTMTSCNLHHVAAEAFGSLPRLRSLRLADNRRLPRADLLASVRRVDTLNKLDVSSSSAFLVTRDLAELFYPDSVDGLRLQELVAAENGIRTVSWNVSTAAVMRSLDLANNELTVFGGGLSQFRRLEHLSVRNNRLTRIDKDAMTGLDRLTTFDASYNKLENLDDGALRPLVRLRRLDLASNRLRTLHPTAVPRNLEYLSVRDNRLVSVAFLASLAHLRSIDVSGNALERLDARLFSRRIRSPVSANFSGNEISSIDGRAFANVSFSVLDLAGNRLERLSLYGADAADVLRADDNHIRDVDDEVFHATRDLHLANNWLRSLLTSCNNDTKLGSSLSLPYVASQAGTAIKSTTSSSVVVLDVSGNPNLGPSIDSQHVDCYSLVGVDQLKIMRARRVGIRRLPVPLIERLTSLRVLDVAENEIDAIPQEAAVAAARLHELNLANNRLVKLLTLAESLALNGESASEHRRSIVNVADNPWHCSCGDVPACRRLTTMLDTSTRHPQHFTPRCVSAEVRSSGQSVFEFCRDLVTAADNNQTTLECLDAQDFEQRVIEETTIFRTFSIIFVAIVLITVPISLACCRLSRRSTTQRCSLRTGGSTRRHGYRIVGETALDFTDVQ